jgi:thiol-disulfide isomerase/thioredoxin
MKPILKYLFPTLLSLTPVSISAQQDTPVQLLSNLLSKIENMSSIEYQVTRPDGYKDSIGNTFKGKTLIIATQTPFRFVATLSNETGTIIQRAVSFNNVTREISNRTEKETRTLNDDSTAMGILSDVTIDVATTWQFLINSKLLRSAISAGQVNYLGEDEIDGDLCTVVFFVDNRIVGGSYRISNYYLWLSKQTGLPRSAQRYIIFRGRTTLSPRVNITIKQLDPQVSDDIFTLQETKTPPEVRNKEITKMLPQKESLINKKLSDLEIRDLSNNILHLSNFNGKPMLINLWAPWCGPCVNEFPTLQKIYNKHQRKLEIIAIAVKDSRLNVLRFDKEHPEYTFTIVTDPEMQDKQSRLYDFFTNEGIPVSVFVNSSGIIVDKWAGFDNESILIDKIDQLMKKWSINE